MPAPSCPPRPRCGAPCAPAQARSAERLHRPSFGSCLGHGVQQLQQLAAWSHHRCLARGDSKLERAALPRHEHIELPRANRSHMPRNRRSISKVTAARAWWINLVASIAPSHLPGRFETLRPQRFERNGQAQCRSSPIFHIIQACSTEFHAKNSTSIPLDNPCAGCQQFRSSRQRWLPTRHLDSRTARMRWLWAQNAGLSL